jgi:hypothetical protein
MQETRFARRGLIFPVFLALLIAWSPSVLAHVDPPEGGAWSLPVSGGMTWDGNYVHNVGELQMNITNFGVFGSYPTWGIPMSESPSAQWPAGSGVEYLWSAGIWTGALVSGNPYCSTTDAGQWEFRPGNEEIYTVYRSFEGSRGGNRLPSPAVDDDGDGLIDEDPLDGVDNDGDGAVDEDYAAISNQMFTCTYRDYLPESFGSSADHHPLNLHITQQSYQWENDKVDDFVGVEFTIRNVGEQTLEAFYLAFFADPDVGPRDIPANYEDDLVDVVTDTRCVQKGSFSIPVSFAMGVAFDDDGDEGRTEGEVGIMFMGHSIDPSGETAPPRVQLRSWQAFSGNASFEEGGDPSNDRERYLLMSSESSDRPPIVPRDYRMLLSAGPFLFLAGDSLEFQVAFVVGRGREGLLENAAQAKLTFDGNWFNMDHDINTPPQDEPCDETYLWTERDLITWQNPCDSLQAPWEITPDPSTWMWVNDDCLFEDLANQLCDNQEIWCTGVDGKETQIHWLYGSPPPPPNLRIWPTEEKNVLFWDNFSELVPDVSELIYDFEGYRVWKAEGWERPFGSSIANGPPSDLWALEAEFDHRNGLSPDTGLEPIRYQPNIDANLVTYYSEALILNPGIESALELLPPTGYSIAEADTAIALAKTVLGLPGGRTYYKYEDYKIHTGMHYFYSVTSMDHVPIFDDYGDIAYYERGLTGDPSAGFVYTVPQSASQPAWNYDSSRIYVVPNPATYNPDAPRGERGTMEPWALGPNNEDPTGLKVEFRHLPAANCQIKVFTLAGDLVQTLQHDASGANSSGDFASTGTVSWDLVSRNGQDVASGIYLYTVETSSDDFERFVGKFTVIR